MRVTSIIKAAGMVDDRWFTDFDRDRGSALHLACQMWDEGDLDEDSLDPVVVDRFRAYQAFSLEVRPEIVAIEQRVVHPHLNYTGTPDRILKIRGHEGVLDIKPPTPYAWHAIQLAAYADCFSRPLRRWALHLRDDRTFRIVEHKDRNDIQVFRAAMVIAGWKDEKGMTDE